MATTGIEYFGENRLIQLIDLIYGEITKYRLATDTTGLSDENFTTALKQKLDGIDLSLYSDTVQVGQMINAALQGVTGISFSQRYASFTDLTTNVTAPQNGVIYLVANGSENDEYYWDGSKFELFGSTSVNLTGYLKDTDLTEIPAATVLAKWQAKFGN